jgi:selenide,water dikinase
MGPADLKDMLTGVLEPDEPDWVIIGVHDGEDTGVIRAPSGELWSHSVDVLTPLVDDPKRFGRIAASNALSDLFAAGAEPRTALCIMGIPDGFPAEDARAILSGLNETVRASGAFIIGGHTVRAPELQIGCSVSGIHPPNIRRRFKKGGRPGDALYLTQALGSGVLTTAFRRGRIGESELEECVSLMERTNQDAARCAARANLRGATDVTGFGFLGHLLQMIEEAGFGAEIDASALPILSGAEDLAAEGFIPGGTRRNRDFVQESVQFTDDVPEHLRWILCDAQTSGGLLLSCPRAAQKVLEQALSEAGLYHLSIGALAAWSQTGPRIRVRGGQQRG